MPKSASEQQLKTYLDRVVKQGSIEAIADDKDQVMRMTGIKPGRKSKLQKAHGAVQKLAMGKKISAEEAFFVEAIIIPDKRPAVVIQNNDYKVDHQDWLHLNEAKGVKRQILKAIPAIGRIELPNHPSIPYGGTGFVVGPNLVMTNRHVAEIFTSGVGLRDVRFKSGSSAAIDFRREADSTASHVFDVKSIAMVHPFWDMAILHVEGLGNDIEPLCLSKRPPEDLEDAEIAAIGYPAFDPRNNVDVQRDVFDNVFNVKRLQPGLLRTRRRLNSFGNTVDTVTHDASTLGGNSGSAVLDLATGEVIALHFAGLYLDANFAVPSFDLSRDGRVVDTGVDFGEDDARNVEDPTPWEQSWRGADPEAEAITVRPSAGGDSTMTVQSHPGSATGDVSLTIPLIVNVRLGDVTSTAGSKRKD